MFVRKRKGSFQIVSSYRENGKVKHRSIANLGPCETIAAGALHWLCIVNAAETERRALASGGNAARPYERHHAALAHKRRDRALAELSRIEPLVTAGHLPLIAQGLEAYREKHDTEGGHPLALRYRIDRFAEDGTISLLDYMPAPAPENAEQPHSAAASRAASREVRGAPHQKKSEVDPGTSL